MCVSPVLKNLFGNAEGRAGPGAAADHHHAGGGVRGLDHAVAARTRGVVPHPALHQFALPQLQGFAQVLKDAAVHRLAAKGVGGGVVVVRVAHHQRAVGALHRNEVDAVVQALGHFFAQLQQQRCCFGQGRIAGVAHQAEVAHDGGMQAKAGLRAHAQHLQARERHAMVFQVWPGHASEFGAGADDDTFGIEHAGRGEHHRCGHLQHFFAPEKLHPVGLRQPGGDLRDGFARLHPQFVWAVQRAGRAFGAQFGGQGSGFCGTVQGALELLQIPYTGSGVMASSIAMDKTVTKRLWSTMALPTPAFAMLTPGFDPNQVAATLGLPIAVKPVSEGSSLGMTKVMQTSELLPAYAMAAKFDRQVMAEAFVSGREFTCALLELAPGEVIALPVIEIVAPEGQYDYQNKYFGSATRYVCPAPIDDAIRQQMQSVSVAAFRALGCSGWARADLMWDGQGSPMLLEINTSPGMTDHSLVPMAAAEVGLNYDDLVLQILSSSSLKLEARA